MSSATVPSTPERSHLVQGAAVMTTFGLAWAVVGISGLGLPLAAALGAGVVAVAAAVATTVAVRRAVGRLPADAGSGRRVRPTAGRTYQLVNLAQTGAVVVAVFGLVRAGQPGLIPPVVCAVVGLHFLPLARVFDLPLYRWTGGLLVLVAGAGALALALGLGDGPVRVVVGLPAAAVLWGTAVAVARRG